MLSKASLAYCVITLFVLNSIPPTHAFGTDLLEQLTDLLFGSDESSEESMETVINTKPNATLMVVCTTGCNLTVMCTNCTNMAAVMMPPANGNGGGNGNGSGTGASNGNGSGNGNGMTSTKAPTMSTAGMSGETTTPSAETTTAGKKRVL